MRAYLRAPVCTAGMSSRVEAVKARIVRAIQAGAPLYNQGNVAGCERLYRECYAEILRNPESLADPRVSEILQRQLSKLQEGFSDRNAWQLRYGFDEVLELRPPKIVLTPEAVKPSSQQPLVTISDARSASQFQSMNDGVMGGVSSGQVTFNIDDRCASYVGVVRTANNGGFSSIRMQQRFPDAQGFNGFYVDCMSQDSSKIFEFSVKDLDGLPNYISYKASFKPPVGTFSKVFIPFSAFGPPERMGRILGGPGFDKSSLAEIGFMIKKPSTGEFAFFFREIGLYT